MAMDFLVPDPSDPLQSQTITLPDGRTLAYAEYGDPKGIPIFFMHGYFGTRLDAVEFGKTEGVRIICPDRPGCGMSTHKPGRTMLDFPLDVKALAESLGYSRYHVYGQSGGGPYALACAYVTPESVIKVGVAAGLGPWDPCGTKGMNMTVKILTLTMHYMPWMIRFLLWCTRAHRLFTEDQKKLEDGVLKGARGLKHEKDREIMSDPNTVKAVVACVRELFRNGSEGCVVDGQIFARDWGFDPKDIEKEVLLWHGDDDQNAPFEHAVYLSKRIPGVKFTVFEGETHFTFWPKFGDMLHELVDYCPGEQS